MAYLPGQQYAQNAAGVWTAVGYTSATAALPVNMVASSGSVPPVSATVSATAAATVTGTTSTTGTVVAPVFNSGNATIALVGGVYSNLTLAFEACFDAAGLYWAPVDAARVDSSTVDLQPNFTATGVRAWNIIAPGYQYVRVRVVAITSTTAPTIIINQGPFLYDPSPTVSPIDGVKFTYSAALNNTVVANAVTAGVPIWEIQNPSAATKLVRVTRLSFQLTLATAGAAPVLQLVKRSTVSTAGTAVTQTAIPSDSSAPASTVVNNLYTAAPTPGTAIGIVRTTRMFGVATVLTATPSGQEWYFGNRPAQAVVLRANQALSLTAQAAFGTAPTITGDVEWTEE